VPAPGQGPPRHHRSTLGSRRRRINPKTTRHPQQRRLRRLLELPHQPRTPPSPRIPLRSRSHTQGRMTSLQRICTHSIMASNCSSCPAGVGQ
jgi:hypothetical protein